MYATNARIGLGRLHRIRQTSRQAMTIMQHSPYTRPNWFLPISQRSHTDYVRAPTPDGGIIRVPLSSPKVIGTSVSRGTREYQEDRHTVTSIHIPYHVIEQTIDKLSSPSKPAWDPKAVGTNFASQMLFAGIYDGHGGSTVSEYLHNSLQDSFEHVDLANSSELVSYLKNYGGYFRRFRGGALAPWADPDVPSTEVPDLEVYSTFAFLQADRTLSDIPETTNCGATSSVVLVQSLDKPHTLFHHADNVLITVAHCGDTRVVLCNTDATCEPLSANHHADERGEEERLRRIGGGVITDSFGDARWMGALANTRCLGDSQFKRFGVTPEPEVRTRIISGSSATAIVLMSDGVSGYLSDEEVADLVRGCSKSGPTAAAKEVVELAEELGTEDNCTVIVIPLKGWNTWVKDGTRELREFRRRNAMNSERQRRM